MKRVTNANKRNRMLVLSLAGLSVLAVLSFSLYSRHSTNPYLGHAGTKEFSGRQSPATRFEPSADDVNAAVSKEFKPHVVAEVQLDPAEAKRRIEEYYRNTNNIDSRSAFALDLIKKLCENGYSKEAWDIIDSGSGQVRNSQLATFFAVADLPLSDLRDRLVTLEFASDASPSFMGYLERFDLDGLLKELRSPELNDMLNRTRERGLNLNGSSAVYVSLVYASQDQKEKALNTALKLSSEGFLIARDYVGFVNDYGPEDVFEKWKWVIAMDSEKNNGTSDAHSQRVQLIDKMVSSNAPLAIERILKDPSAMRSENVSAAIESWNQINPSGATDWYGANQAFLSQGDRDLVASSFARDALDSRELDEAVLWADEITDLQAKELLLKSIEKERAKRDSSK